MTTTTICDNNGLFLYIIYRGHVIIEWKREVILLEVTQSEDGCDYMIYDTDSVEVAAKLHRKFDHCEEGHLEHGEVVQHERSFAGAMQRVDKWL